MNSQLILVDEKDKELGYASLEETHSGRGKKHRAFVTLLFDEKGRVLLQRRKHRLFDGLWDLTAVSHPLRANGKTESYQEASNRALKKEMRIGHVDVDKVGAFNYFALDGRNCENEYCAILTGEFSGKFKPNNQEVYEVKWVRYADFIADIDKKPSKFTAWARETARILASRESLIDDSSDQRAFKKELKLFVEEFTKFSKQFFSKKRTFVKKYPSLISRFYKELEEFGAGGKAMRPFLIYLGYRIGQLGQAETGSDPKKGLKKIMPVCLAIELIHDFLLIHDDIIDRSQIRRGRETVHRRLAKGRNEHYGVSQAIVVGDIAYIEAVDLINKSGFDAQMRSECLGMLSKVIIETAYGEILDVEYAWQRPKFSQVWQVTELKTARYSFVGPLTIGAIVAGARKKQILAIEKYGLSTGCAFQIQDDILGVFGDEKVLGKSTLSDMREGKNTALFYKTRELASGQYLQDLGKIWGNPKASKSDLKKVQLIMQRTGALAWCNRQMRELVLQAKKAIGAVTSDNKLANILAECADFVIYREK